MTLRVLVADDDPDYRFLVRAALEPESGIELVAEAACADELLDASRRAEPDLVLLDASLDDGLAVAARLHEDMPDVRVVLTSSLPARFVATSVVAAGACGSLAKDIPLRQIAGALVEHATLAAAAERAMRTATAALPSELISPRHSRRLARDTLEGWCDPDVFSEVELLISELVANGVEHAETPVDVRIAVSATTIRVEVGDRSPVQPVIRSPRATESSGRGMRIVDQTATRWGVQARRTGKCVWFELPRRRELAAG